MNKESGFFRGNLLLGKEAVKTVEVTTDLDHVHLVHQAVAGFEKTDSNFEKSFCA